LFATQPSEDLTDQPAARGGLFSASLVAFVVLAILLGGSTGQGFLSDAVIQLCGLPVLFLALWRIDFHRFDPAQRAALWFPFALVLLLLLYLVPLPPAVWTLLPGRDAAVSGFDAAQLPLPWLPVSLDAGATWRGTLSLIPALAVFYAVLQTGENARRAIAVAILMAAIASFFVSLFQLSQGPESALRFYDVTVPNRMVGFFANPNHYAAFLCLTIPIAVVLALRISAIRSAEGIVALVGMILIILLLILSVAMVRSLAGLALGFLAILGAAALMLPHLRRAYGGRGTLAVVILALAFTAFAVSVALPRAGEATGALSEQTRVVIAKGTLEAIASYLPFGSGFGTFIPVYAMEETTITAQNNFINRAHNDWLEWTLEGGLPAATLALGHVLLYGLFASRAWNGADDGFSFDDDLRRAAVLVVGILLLHSLVDYPLRTTALMVVFAFASAALVSRAPKQHQGYA